MARGQEKAQLDRPLQEVWGLFIDPDRWLEWNTELVGMRDVRGPFDHPVPATCRCGDWLDGSGRGGGT